MNQKYVPHPLRLVCRTWISGEPEVYDSGQPGIEFPSSTHDDQDCGAGSKTPRLGHSQLRNAGESSPDKRLDSSQVQGDQVDATGVVFVGRAEDTPQSGEMSDEQESSEHMSSEQENEAS
jgi:hypothetical protein